MTDVINWRFVIDYITRDQFFGLAVCARRRMVQDTGAQASMDANEIEPSSSSAMTSSDDVMKLNGDVTTLMHNAAPAVSRRDVTTTPRDGGIGRGPTSMNGASDNSCVFHGQVAG